jgi:hypothetical protein
MLGHCLIIYDGAIYVVCTQYGIIFAIDIEVGSKLEPKPEPKPEPSH